MTGSWMGQDNLEYLVDITRAGTDDNYVSSAGYHFEYNYRTTGTINVGDDVHQIDDDDWFYLIGDTEGSSSKGSTTRNGSSTIDGDTYTWHDGFWRNAFSDGSPSEVDSYWQVSGELDRNGASFGHLELQPMPAGAGYQLILVLPDERYELATFLS